MNVNIKIFYIIVILALTLYRLN